MGEKPGVQGAIAGEGHPGLLLHVVDHGFHPRGDLSFRHVYAKLLFDGLGQALGITVLVGLPESLQDVFPHLDLLALKKTLDDQREMDAQTHEGAVGNRIRQALNRRSGQVFHFPQPVFVYETQQPVRDAIRGSPGGFARFLRERQERRFVEVLQDYAAHSPPSVALLSENLDAVTASTQKREPEVREPVLYLVQVAADRPYRDLESARERPELDRLIRGEEHAKQRYLPLFRRELRRTHVLQGFQHLLARLGRPFDAYASACLPHERQAM